MSLASEKPSRSRKRVTLALTGASGAPYGLKLLEQLLAADCEVFLLMTKAAHLVVATETSWQIPGKVQAAQSYLEERLPLAKDRLTVLGQDQWFTPPASGSGKVDAMVVCPCSMGSLSAIATGASNNLMERAADVMLKERKPLIIVPRETPFNSIHLENMLKLSQMGVVILPASPGFYHEPTTIDDLVDFVVARILKQLGIEQTLLNHWGESS